MKTSLSRFISLKTVALGSLIIIAAVFSWQYFAVPQSAQTELPRANTFERFYAKDDATRAIRDANSELIRIPVKTDEERAAALLRGTPIESYESFVVIAQRSGEKSTSTDSSPIETRIYLPGKSFDPLAEQPPETITENGDGINLGAKDYYIVQLGAPTRDEWLDSFRELGIEVLQYVPHQAFFVYASPEAIQKITTHSRVRWVGRYFPEAKISPELRAQLSAARGFALDKKISPLELTGEGKSIFDIAIWKRAGLSGIQAQLEMDPSLKIRNKIVLPLNYFDVLRVEMPLDAVSEIAKISDVIRVDPYFVPKGEDERAAQIVAGNYTSTTSISGPGYNPLTQFRADGTNVTVSVVDDGVSIPGNGGLYLTSANTVNGPLRSAAAGATGGHGHINASIIAGNTPFGILDPTGHNYGLGVAPKSHLINIPLLVAGYTGTEALAYNDTVTTAGPNGVLGSISNNSWGSGTNANAYDSYAAQFDGFVRDASTAGTIDPIMLVFSAGNSGASGLTRPKMAKNIIAVGNSENLRTELSSSANNIDDLASSSSIGPAADTRIKPDITAPGTVITGSRAGSCTSVSSCFDANHAWSTGTSHAAPQVAGAAALFTNWWKNNAGGANPSPSLIKAVILNTGQEMNGVGTANPIPNGAEGWGRINMKYMFAPVRSTFINETASFFGTGAGVAFSRRVTDSTKPVRITLVWTDPPGTVDPALVNNIDLTVTVGANVYKGNVFSGGTSTTGGTADSRNNVEQVWLPAGIPKDTLVTISLTASAINGDGIPGNGDATDQNISLVGFNLGPGSPVAADFDGDRRTDLSIFRPAPGQWWLEPSAGKGTLTLTFGTSTDKIVPADYDGDGRTDAAFWRPSTGEWFVLRSTDITFYAAPFGISTDKPAPGDFDGDGKADLVVYRSSDRTWYLNQSLAGVTFFTFGATGDIPMVGDYDGDSKSDIAVFRPSGASGAEWWINRSSGGVYAATFGAATDKPVPADYTGDGKTDIAFWRPSDGNWFVLRSEDSSYFAAPFGVSTDIPVPGDYDGDGKFDFAVWRPGDFNWYQLRSSGGVTTRLFGASGDRPAPSAYVP